MDSFAKIESRSEIIEFLSSRSREFNKSLQDQLLYDLPAHAQAFDCGLISCARLVEVLVPPFLQLARKASRETPADSFKALGLKPCTDNSPCDDFLMAWKTTL